MSGGAICKKLCEQLQKNYYNFIIVAAVVTAFGFVFAKLLYLLTAFPLSKFFLAWGVMITHPIKSGLMSSGFVFYGGLLGGILGYLAGVKIARCSFSDFLNIFAFVIPYIHAWGRVGCFCAGCCYGIPYEGPFALHYTHPVSDAPCGPGIFPVQLVEALLLFAFAFCMLVLLLKKKELPFFLLYLIYYSVIRFALEYLRNDKGRGFIGPLSVSQFISIFVFTISLIILMLNLFQHLRRMRS